MGKPVSKIGTQEKPLGGKEASRIAREYFAEIHGLFNVWNFEVESVTREKQNWKIRCSFAPTSTGGAPRSTYEVEVKEDGTIGRVSRVDTTNA